MSSVERSVERWRLPEDEEWRALAMEHGGLWEWHGDIKGNPKRAYSALLKGGSSSFSALLGGWRDTGGSFDYLAGNGYYWSATEDGSGSAWGYDLFSSNHGALNRNSYDKGFGFSCRCVQGAPSNGID